MGIENLQERSFQLARWKLRYWLFGVIEDKPELLPRNLEAKLICYAWITWLYRLILFLGIALLIYQFFFKVLGLILFAVEIIGLIMMPCLREIKYWWRLREKFNRMGAIVIGVSRLPVDRFIMYSLEFKYLCSGRINLCELHDFVFI